MNLRRRLLAVAAIIGFAAAMLLGGGAPQHTGTGSATVAHP